MAVCSISRLIVCSTSRGGLARTLHGVDAMVGAKQLTDFAVLCELLAHLAAVCECLPSLLHVLTCSSSRTCDAVKPPCCIQSY